jgi:hypothetical protein
MVKKIVLGTLFIGLVGLLIFGAVNRTIAKSDGQVARALNWENEVVSEDVGIQPGDGNSRGGWRGQFDQNEAGENGECDEHGGVGQGKNSQVQGSGGGQGRGGQGRNSGREASEPDVHADTILQSLEGTIVNVSPEAVVINTAEGQDVLIEGRAWRYAQEMGYSLQVGQSITVSGFEEDGEFKAVEILAGPGVSAFQFREKSGRPMWAGRGQGNGRNQTGQDI